MATLSRPFHGWLVVVAAAAAMVGTLPGRSQGLGLITEPLLRDFADTGLDRLAYARLNFWATMAGAVGALGIGRAIDRFGSRAVVGTVAIVLGISVAAMSRATSVIGLAIALAATRALGQGALSVVSIAMVGHWFRRRIAAAMAAYSVILSVGFMVAFPAVGGMVQILGWRDGWLAVAILLAAGLGPVALAVVRRSPESIGLSPDGDLPVSAQPAAGDAARPAEPSGYRWLDAVRTAAFWVFAAGSALYGLIASGIGLFNEAILAERGYGADVYYQTLAVTAITALAGNFLAGWLARHLRLTHLMSAALGVLAVATAALPHVSGTATVMTWAAAMGVGGGTVMVLFFSVWPALYGRRHLGRIQGLAQALTVLASAAGPVLLARGVAATGSYATAFRLLAGGVTFVALAALLVRLPRPAQS